MKRTFLKRLVQWKEDPGRKPLILKGARQVGKTYLLHEFGKAFFPAYHYLNFEKDEELKGIFEPNLHPERIVRELGLYLSQKIDKDTDLLVFDEIQACPKALTSLKYFQEEMPELALAAAGSLLGIHLGPVSFPVGKVDMLTLYPMSFEEFLMALGQEEQVNFLREIHLHSTIPEFMHDRLWNQLKLYFIVGGLPEAVSTFSQYPNDYFTAFTKTRSKQADIVAAYYADIAKHSGKENAMHIERLFKAIPTQLGQVQDGSSRKFSFKGVLPGVSRYSRLVGPLDWLEAAGLVIRVPICHSAQTPLLAYTKENEFKLYLYDVGILGAMSYLDPKEIYQYDYGSYKGYFAENFVAQEFLYSGAHPLFSWHEKTAELEFLRSVDGSIIPVEVKSGWVTKAKSLQVYKERYRPKYGCVFSARNLSINLNHGQYYYPLYLASQFPLRSTSVST
jgi:hypothetical protein